MTAKQKEYVAKYFVDVSKLAFAGMVVGKFVSPNPIPMWVLMGGVVFSLLTLIAAILIDRGSEE